MKFPEQKEKALDVIAFLSAFDISYTDARAIISVAYQQICIMNADAFKKQGDAMRDMRSALDKRDGVDTPKPPFDARAHQRIFHNPLGDDI